MYILNGRWQNAGLSIHKHSASDSCKQWRYFKVLCFYLVHRNWYCSSYSDHSQLWPYVMSCSMKTTGKYADAVILTTVLCRYLYVCNIRRLPINYVLGKCDLPCRHNMTGAWSLLPFIFEVGMLCVQLNQLHTCTQMIHRITRF